MTPPPPLADGAGVADAAVIDDDTAASATLSPPTVQTSTELQTAFDFFNARLFDDQLPPCLITIQRSGGCRFLGFFYPKRFRSVVDTYTDEIAINPEHVAVATLMDALSTLVHEMAHQWQNHFGEAGRRGYHNAEWANRMEAIGLMPSHTGKPGGRRTGEKMSHYIVESGPFDQACQALIRDQGFRLTWHDRTSSMPQEARLPFDTSPRPKPPENFVPASAPPAPPVIETPPPPVIEVESTPTAPPTPPVVEDDLAPEAAPDSTADPEPLATSDIDDADAEPPPPAAPPTAAPVAATVTPGEPAVIYVPKPMAKANRSNRTKYRCPGCQVQVWGKPELDVRCGLCDARLEAV